MKAMDNNNMNLDDEEICVKFVGEGEERKWFMEQHSF